MSERTLFFYYVFYFFGIIFSLCFVNRSSVHHHHHQRSLGFLHMGHRPPFIRCHSMNLLPYGTE